MIADTTKPTPWAQLAVDADRLRNDLWRHVRAWAARHAVAPGKRCPGRVVAALDATANGTRSRLVRIHDHTSRERAEAAYADLWDAAAVVWAMVNATPERRGLEHTVAELQGVGRWLAEYPVHAAGHAAAIAALFEQPTTATKV